MAATANFGNLGNASRRKQAKPFKLATSNVHRRNQPDDCVQHDDEAEAEAELELELEHEVDMHSDDSQEEGRIEPSEKLKHTVQSLLADPTAPFVAPPPVNPLNFMLVNSLFSPASFAAAMLFNSPACFPQPVNGNKCNLAPPADGTKVPSPPTTPRDAKARSEAFCEYCSKLFCNKYFLKVHKQNKHAALLKDEEENAGEPQEAAGRPESGSELSEAENRTGAQRASASDERDTHVKRPKPPRVKCPICLKDVCNKVRALSVRSAAPAALTRVRHTLCVCPLGAAITVANRRAFRFCYCALRLCAELVAIIA